MPGAFSGYVTEWHGGRTRAYVNAYVESETDKTATIYVSGCAQATNISQYGVRSACTGGGSGVGVLSCPSWTADYAGCAARFTVNKGSGHYQRCECSIWGDTVSGYGPISGSATAAVDVWVGARVLRPPSSPTNLKAARNAAASIDLSWTNNASNAASTLIWRKKKGKDWVKVYDQGVVRTSYTDSPGIGSFAYRVQYWNSDGFSGYSNATDYIVTLCAPAAPTLVSPASGATVDANAGTALLAWRHNSIDTSKQSAAEVRCSADGTTWMTLSATTAQSASVVIAGNTSVQWQVRTKGAHADFSPWSGVSMFLVRTPPVATLSVVSPITTVPVTTTWTYDDATGTQASAVLSVLDSSGAEVFKAAIVGAEKSRTISDAEWTPKQGQSYTVRLTVVSTTSLAYTTQKVVTVDYAPPPAPSCAVVIDPDTASVEITVREGSGAVATRSMSVFRDDVLVADGLLTGAVCTDKTPPLDRSITYRVVAYAPSGSASDYERETVVGSRGYVYFNFADDLCRMNLNLSYDDNSEAETVLRSVPSSVHPKAFFGIHEERSGNVYADVLVKDMLVEGERTMIEAAKRLKGHKGHVYMRLPYGDALAVVCKVKYSRSCEQPSIAPVSVSWTAVAQ